MSTATDTGFRLSPQQRRTWALGADGPPLYVQGELWLDGELDTAVLRRSLDRLVACHEILRTRFHLPPGLNLPLQVIAPPAAVAWGETDLTGLPAAAAERAAGRLLAADRRRAWDLAAEAPLRARLLARGPRRHLLALTLPALCADPASLGVLCRGLAVHYAAAGRSPEPPPEQQYADFAAVFNELHEDPEMEEARARWHGRDRAQLAAPGLAAEPAAGGRCAPRRVPVAVPPTLAADLDAAAGVLGATPEALLLATWQTLAGRFLDRRPVAFGVGFDGRGYDELAAAVGPFAVRLPVAGPPPPDEPFAAVARRLAGELAAAAEWQEFFSWEVAYGGGPPADFRLAFDGCDLRTGGAAHGVEFRVGAARWRLDRPALGPVAVTTAAGLALALEHDRRAVGATAVARLARAYRRLLAAALATPDRANGALDAVGPDQRHRLVVETAGCAAGSAAGAAPPVHQRFAELARRWPERPAVVAGDRALTYGELEAWSRHLARSLRRRGAGPDTLVGLCTTRSLEMVVGLLGILRAAAAYVPLDPEHPAARRGGQLARLGVRLLVAEPGTDEALPGFTGDTLLVAEPPAPDEPAAAGAPPGPPVDPAHLAYAVHTSGSTGEPKAVGVTHAGLAGYTRALLRRLAIGDGDAWGFATVSTIAADLGNSAIFGALASGGCLHVVDARAAADPERLAAYCRRHRVDVVKIVPSHLGALLESPAAADLLPRRVLILGGEALPATLLAAVRERAPGLRVINHYGPTEVTVGALTWDAGGGERPAPDPGGGVTVPIGEPLDGLRAYLVDRYGAPALDGAPGELLLAGAGLARGYLGRPRETADRFRPDPFVTGAAGGERLYRSGDRARRRPGGGYEFLGRTDDQVKVRGHRVEPGEIEAVLGRHPGVARSAVVTRPLAAGGEARLVAYLVPRAAAGGAGDAGADPEAVRRFLAARLPDYMVPAAFVSLAELPLTANGKVDRAALPALEDGAPARFVAPRTAVERRLAEIWSAVLGVERVGVEDDFFAHGGDSIASIQVVGRAQRAGLRLEPIDVFRHPTVAALARRLEESAGEPGEPPEERAGRGETATGATAVEATPGGDPEALAAALAPLGDTEAVLPLSPLQQGVLFEAVHRPRPGLYVSQLRCELVGDLDPEAMAAAWATVLARHTALRTGFLWQGVDEPVQVVLPRVGLPLTLRDWRQLPPGERRQTLSRELAADRERGFDLARAPLLRLILARLEAERWALAWTYHHLVMDGWSEPVVVAGLFRAYRGARRGVPPALPAARPYGDYVAWLAGRGLEAAETFWRGYLDGFTAPTRLPGDAGAEAAAVGAAEERSLRLPAAASAALAAAARGAGLTLNTVALGVWAILLAALGGARDVVFGATVAGRPADLPGVEGIVGLFINTLPVRARVDAAAPLVPWLRRLQAEQAEARRFEHTPLVAVQGWSEVPRGTPLFDTLFVFQSQPLAGPDGRPEAPPGLRVAGLDFRGGSTGFPLSVDVAPGDELTLTMTHDPGRLDGRAVARWLDALATLLTAVGERPEVRLGELEAIAAAACGAAVAGEAPAAAGPAALRRARRRSVAAGPRRPED